MQYCAKINRDDLDRIIFHIAKKKGFMEEIHETLFKLLISIYNPLSVKPTEKGLTTGPRPSLNKAVNW
jgi:hypothetical protein